MPANDDETAGLVRSIVAELGECRQRGIERLDRHAHKQSPVAADNLQRLAHEYVNARQIPAHGRIAQIKVLLRHALDDLARQGDEADASLIRDLFFGDSVNAVVQSAGELLENAQRKTGEGNEARFRERRQTALQVFADFLVQFVAEARSEASGSGPTGTGADTSQPSAGLSPASAELAGPAIQDLPVASDAPADPGAAVTRHEVITGYVEHGERFVSLLAEALSVTIVGFTNEQLAERLDAALRRKRLARPDAFWNSLRIVYLSTGLLDFLNDERSEFPDRKEAVRLRRLAATYGHRSLLAFLRRAPSFRWALYEMAHVPPFIGTLFEMPSGRRVVQLLIRRPQRSTPDHLFIELDDLPDQYFAAAFEDIVYNSVSDNKIVPIGLPVDGAFRCTGKRYRQNVLADGSGATGWLPLVLVITYQRRAGRAEVLLQRRTADTAAREIGRLSHLSGHIYYHDAPSFDAAAGDAPLVLDLEHGMPVQAARRRVQMETGDDLPPALRPVGTGRYLHHDKEHLFFFVYAFELPEDFQFSRRAEMNLYPLPELLLIRENHALRNALLLCRSALLPDRAWAVAAEIAGLNLIMHDHGDLADRLMDTKRPSAAALADVIARLAQLERGTRQSWYTGGREVEVLGFSGWQYREFFKELLPLYAELGVSGASEQLGLVHGNDGKRRAVDRLNELYHDENRMVSLPVEL